MKQGHVSEKELAKSVRKRIALASQSSPIICGNTLQSDGFGSNGIAAPLIWRLQTLYDVTERR